MSECSDWASHSRARGVVAVGVGAGAAKGMLDPERARGGGTGDDEVDLNDERRFCADDLRRIVGRGGSCIDVVAIVIGRYGNWNHCAVWNAFSLTTLHKQFTTLLAIL